MRFELDCASTMFVLGQTKRRRYIIRMSVILNDTVDECVLQKALERTAKIYPYFFVEFISKFGQLYAGPVADLPPVREKLIKNYIPMKSKDEKWEAMVSYNDKTIYLEYFHAVSDGKGGSEFFKTMIANYLAMKYDVSIINSIKPLSIADQTVNGYKMSAEGIASQKKSGIAYRIKGTKNPCGLINVTSFLLSVDEIKKKSMEYQVSITEFLSAVLCLAIWNIQQEKRAFIQKNKTYYSRKSA